MPENEKNTRQGNEIEFLDGPNSRLREFLFVVDVLKEFVRGFRF